MKGPNCGKEIANDSVFCEFCGTRVQNVVVNPGEEDSEVDANFFAKLVSFLFPIIGLILLGVWKNKKPRAAKACMIAAVWGFVVGLIFNLIIAFMGY